MQKLLTKSNLLEKNTLALKLKPVFIGQIIIMDSLEKESYTYNEGLFDLVLQPGEGITQDFIKEYALQNGKTIFVHDSDYATLKDKLHQEIIKVTRSLSIGDAFKNGNKHANLLTLQMSNLYQEPFNDTLLNSQFQSTKNLSTLLLNNKKIHKPIYHNLNKQGHHYTHTQPLQSSLLLLSFLQELGVFSNKEIENFFLTSYFKDIGMSFIPRENFDLVDLSNFDKKLFAEHAENSMLLLSGRIPLTKNHLNIIENHHYLNYKIQAKAQGKLNEQEFLSGIESALISSIDILVAMTSNRPYREAISPFKALELLKHVLIDEHPQEFKALVVFLKKFFSK